MSAPLVTKLQHDELPPSKLGTKEYWEERYEMELRNFKDIGDVEVWFHFDCMERMLDWIEESPLVSEDQTILDLGCGNGVLCVELYKRGYKHVTGVDYCDKAIELAKSIAADQDINIPLETGDILQVNPSEGCLQSTYDVLVDKGTYDAISIDPDDSKTKRLRYIANANHLLKPEGLLVLTSCNWTEDELEQQFCSSDHAAFNKVGRIPAPTFQFGGVTGNRESSLILQKKS